jgi:hypothetical protein
MNKINDSFAIREASSPDDTERLPALHQHYSEQRFAGWNDYLSVELKGSLWVLVAQNEDTSSAIVAWLSIGHGEIAINCVRVGMNEWMFSCAHYILQVSKYVSIRSFRFVQLHIMYYYNNNTYSLLQQ